jgi:carboxypeptidase Taq
MNKQQALDFLMEQDRELTLLGNTSAILEWDQETQMPEEAVEGRSKQLSLLASMMHTKIVDPKVNEALSALEATDDNPTGIYETKSLEGALVRGWFKGYARSSRLSNEFVKKLSEATSIGQARWAQARKEDEFAKFLPHLETIIGLKREAAEAIGYADEPYDALLDEFEPNTTSKEIETVFTKLREDLVPIVKAISEADQVDTSPVYRNYPADIQENFGRSVLKSLNYDLQRGRLDLSTHPFTTTLGFDDVRITARYDEEFFNTGLFSIIHEAGHGLYEQGFNQGSCRS